MITSMFIYQLDPIQTAPRPHIAHTFEGIFAVLDLVDYFCLNLNGHLEVNQIHGGSFLAFVRWRSQFPATLQINGIGCKNMIFIKNDFFIQI